MKILAALAFIAAWFVSGGAYAQIQYQAGAANGVYSPLNGATVKGSINVRVPGCDGAPWAFSIDGRPHSTEYSCPFGMGGDDFLYNTLALTEGPHTITANALSATFVVDNIQDTPPPPQPQHVFHKAGCYTNSLIWKARLTSLPGAVVWFCDRPSGLQRNHWTWSSWNSSAPAALPLSDEDLAELEKVVQRRDSTQAEMVVVSDITRQWAPKCYTQTSGTATTVPVYSRTATNARGAQRRDTLARPVTIAPNVQATCYIRLSAVTTRYCLVAGLQNTNGEAIAADSYARCSLKMPPAAGWP